MKNWPWNVALIASVLTPILLSSCNRNPEPSTVSEKPESMPDAPLEQTQAGTSRFGMRARVSYADIEAIAAEHLPASYPVTGERRLCKRIIGIKICGTAQWNLLVERTSPLQMAGAQQRIDASAPLRFTGVVGIRGAAAEALGLSDLQVSGSLITTLSTGMEMHADWCPQLQVDASYQWLEKPTAIWRGKLDFDLETIVNEALDKQLATLQPRLNERIDCQRFRQQLSTYWHSYSFALDIPATAASAQPQEVHLNIVPSGFSFSGIHTDTETLGIGFELEGTTVVASDALPAESLPLPPLRKVDFKTSRTDFDLLLRADYTQLESVISPLVLEREYSSESAAGKVSVVLKKLDLSSNRDGVTVALDFVAQLPGSRRDTQGTIYLTASPVVDAAGQSLRLDNIRLSRVIDSTLWNLLSSVFEGQIIASIERASTLDLSDHTRKLEQRLLAQLQDPTRTGGVNVRVEDLTIRLLGLFPETDALAARARVSAELDIDIPLAVLKKPLQ